MPEDATPTELIYELANIPSGPAEGLDALRQTALEYAKNSVIRVGYGRGFVAQTVDNPVIITCAHCLPHVPPAIGALLVSSQNTYPSLVGVLDQEPTITVECLFADPVADVAVLGEPDDHALSDEAEAYRAFVEEREGLRIAAEQNAALPVHNRKGAWLTLEGKWVQHSLEVNERCVWTGERSESGMSGSPIILDTVRRTVVGVVASSEVHPRLVTALPAWLLRKLILH